MFAIIFLSIDKNSATKTINNNKNNETETEQEEKNISLIKNEVEDINNEFCNFLSIDIGYDITSNEDLFSYYASPIMGCIYDANYKIVTLDNITDYIIVSEEEQSDLKNYFTQDLNLILYDEEYDRINPEDSSLKEYYNKEYKIILEISGPGISDINYSLDKITKSNDSYNVTINATYNNISYTGNTNVKIVDNHCQFSELIFNKAI
jgi:hypothetical protein